MKTLVGMTAALAVMAAGAAKAEIYKDWTPQKGGWQVTEIHVDSNHIDDYLTGLKTTWVTGNEISKKHGVIDDYRVLLRIDPAGKGANVLLELHYPTLAMLDPDMARDKAIEKEGYEAVSKDKGKEMVAGYEKYRSFVGDGVYSVVTFGK